MVATASKALRPSAMRRSNGSSEVALTKRSTRSRPATEAAASSTKPAEESSKPGPPPLKGSVKPIDHTPTDKDQFLQDQAKRLLDSNTAHGRPGLFPYSAQPGHGHYPFLDDEVQQLQMVAAIQQHNLNRGMILNDNDLKQQVVNFVNHVLIYYLPFPDWQHLSTADKTKALAMIQRKLGLSDASMAVRKEAIEGYISKALRNKRTDSSNRSKQSYLGRKWGLNIHAVFLLPSHWPSLC